MATISGMAASIRAATESETFDLAGQDAANIPRTIADAFSQPFALDRMIRITFVTGAGKLKRHKYDKAASQAVVAALRDLEFVEDRGARCVNECAGCYKTQHDTGKNLYTVIVFPRLAEKEAQDAHAGSGRGSVPSDRYPIDIPLVEGRRDHTILVASDEAFAKMAPSMCPSWSEKKCCSEILRAAMETMQQMDAKLMSGTALTDDEDEFYNGAGGTTSVANKGECLKKLMHQQVEDGNLTQRELEKLLQQVQERIDGLNKDIDEAVQRSQEKRAAKLTAQKEKAEARRKMLRGHTAKSPHPLKHETKIAQLTKQLKPLLQQEPSAKGRLLTMKETRDLAAKDEMLDEIAELEDASRGWFEDEESFRVRLEASRKKQAAASDSAKSSSGKGKKPGAVSRSMKASNIAWLTPGVLASKQTAIGRKAAAKKSQPRSHGGETTRGLSPHTSRAASGGLDAAAGNMDAPRVELAADDPAPVPPAQIAAAAGEDASTSAAKRKTTKGHVELIQDEEGPAAGPGMKAANPDAVDRKLGKKGGAPSQTERGDEDSICMPREEDVERTEPRGWEDIQSAQRRKQTREENPPSMMPREPRGQQSPSPEIITRPPPPSMMPREPSAPMFHSVEATLVPDEPEHPVVDAVAVRIEDDQTTLPLWRRHQKCVLLALVISLLAIVALAVVMGTLLPSRDDDAESATKVVPTPSPGPGGMTAPPILLLVQVSSPVPTWSPTSLVQSTIVELWNEEFIPLSDEWVNENVAVYGDTALLGASANDNNRGVVFVFAKGVNGEWIQQATLEAPDGVAGDRFGYSVGIDGDVIVVGADGDVGGSASAYLFVWTGDTWTHQAKLVAPFGAIDYWSGQSVGIHQDYVVLGGGGSAHVFFRTGETWDHQATLLPPEGQALEYFGHSVSIHEDSIIVGDNGASEVNGSAHIFIRSGVDWNHQAKLASPEGGPWDLTWDLFGESVGIYGDHAVVGSHWAKDNGDGSGAAHVFVRNGSDWDHQSKLLAFDGGPEDYFGSAVAIHGNQILVGAHGGGSAYMFVRNQTDWSHHTKLVDPFPVPENNWGRSVAIHNGTAIVGSVHTGADLFLG